jgi:hypothetical protein
MSVPTRADPAIRDSSAVKLSPSRHVQDTGLLPTFGQPGCLIAPVAALPHDRATLAVADLPDPGSHALSGGPSRLRQADPSRTNHSSPLRPGTPAARAGPSASRAALQGKPRRCRCPRRQASAAGCACRLSAGSTAACRRLESRQSRRLALPSTVPRRLTWQDIRFWSEQLRFKSSRGSKSDIASQLSGGGTLSSAGAMAADAQPSICR